MALYLSKLFCAIMFFLYDILLFFCRFAPSLSHRRRLTRHALTKDFNLYLEMSQANLVDSVLAGGKLTYLSVGARGDEQDDLMKLYQQHFSLILCEPEKTESLRLESLGFKTIGKPLYSASKTIPFYICRDATKSSLYKTGGPFMDYYNPDPSYIALWDVVEQEEMQCSTINDSLGELGLGELDLLKMDVQGAELDILQGMGAYSPLMMIIEVQYLPMYEGMPSGYALINHVYEMGYIPLQVGANFNSAVAPSVGDVIFMPNWTHERGREMIMKREREYIALMCMFDQFETLRFVSKKLGMKNHDLIKQKFSEFRRKIYL